jgi:hypothetical protein
LGTAAAAEFAADNLQKAWIVCLLKFVNMT